jgi:predicted metal-dependent peptidase
MWNYATDWAINSMIPVDELPEEGLRPGREFTPLTDEQLGRMTPEQVANYQKISDFQASLPLEKSSEWYFERLMDNPDVKKAVENGNKVGGKSLGQALEDGDVKFDENGDLVDSNGNPVDLVPGSMDDHDGWDELTEEERQIVKGKLKKTLEKATRDADSKGAGWGSISADHRALIRKLISNEIPWQSVLKQFCGMTRRANRHSNVRRLNRKYPGIHPGVQKGYTSSIAVYIDQSGSVSDSELELLFGELASLARNTSFTVYHFDTEVDETSETEWKKGRVPTTLRTRSGGTCFKAPTVHANKNKHRFDGYLILTDGGAPNPGSSKLKRGWVITPGQDLYFKDTSPRDFVIRMKKKAAA